MLTKPSKLTSKEPSQPPPFTQPTNFNKSLKSQTPSQSISAIQFEPKHIAETEDGFYVLKPEPTTLNIVVTNEGNKTEYDIVLIVLVTDEDSNTVYEKIQKEAILEPGRSKTIQLEAIKLSPGVSYEWIIKLEEVEKEEEIDDNLYRVKGFVPLDS